MRFTPIFVLLGVLLLSPSLAHAIPVTFVGTDGGTLSASAQFTISGNTLTIVLTNTATAAIPTGSFASNQALSGVFFSLTGSPLLSPGTATISAGSLIQGSNCDVACDGTTTNVGGEFAFATSGTYNLPALTGATYGVSSSGYIGVNSGNMGGTNLDNPDAPNGANFAIVPTNFVAFTSGNGGLDGDPLILGSVTLTLTGVQGLTEANIGNVYFTYGTTPEAYFPGTPGGGGGPGGNPIPEPGSLVLLGTGLSALAVWQVRRRKK